MRIPRLLTTSCSLFVSSFVFAGNEKTAPTINPRGNEFSREVAVAPNVRVDEHEPTTQAASITKTNNVYSIRLGLPSSWPAVHHDSRNSNFVPFSAPKIARVAWTALDGAVTLLAPSIGPEGNLYVTTGQGPGKSNFHAFDRHGRLLWESPPQQDLEDLDARAVGSAPLVDRRGDVYIGDSNQLWAFHSDGSLKWVVPLPDPTSPLVSCVTTEQGYVGGVTTMGKVVFFRRTDGSLAAPVFSLPGGSGPTGPSVPPGLWQGGLMDPTIIEQTYHGFMGFGDKVTNTPAIQPKTGRLFIIGAGSSPSQGVLYALDIKRGSWSIAFQTPVGAASGSSCAISPDGEQVYAVGGDGIINAIDAESGIVVWTASDAGKAASPSVGSNGVIYTGTRNLLTALNPVDGSILWRIDFNPLAQAYLPERVNDSGFFSSVALGWVNSVVTVTPTHLLVAVVLGNAIEYPNGDLTPPMPRLTLLCSIDSDDGALLSTMILRDTSEGVISVGNDGRLYISHGALMSSIAYYGVNPLLPPWLQVEGPPKAGISALEPVSYLDQAVSGIQWARDLLLQSLDEAMAGNIQYAQDSVDLSQDQLAASTGTLSTDAASELDNTVAYVTQSNLLKASGLLLIARNVLRDDVFGAIDQIRIADQALDETIALLQNRSIVQMDILSGLCPKSLSVPLIPRITVEIAVAGTAQFSVRDLDLSSVRLSRADVSSKSVAPIPSLRGEAGRFRDVTGSTLEEICGCSTSNSDGIEDVVFTFSVVEMFNALMLGSVPPNYAIPLKLTGLQDDGTVFQAVDCITVNPR